MGWSKVLALIISILRQGKYKDAREKRQKDFLSNTPQGYLVERSLRSRPEKKKHCVAYQGRLNNKKNTERHINLHSFDEAKRLGGGRKKSLGCRKEQKGGNP